MFFIAKKVIQKKIAIVIGEYNFADSDFADYLEEGKVQ